MLSLTTILLLLAQLQLSVCAAVPEAAEPEAASSCGHQMAPADIAILLDSTFSIGRENLDGVKDLVKNVADQVNYGPEDARLATIRWSRTAKEVIGLDDFADKQDMFDALAGVEFRGGGGQVHKALNLLREKTFSQPRDNVARIGVLVIDEKSHNTPAAVETAQKLHEEGVKMIVMGVKRRRFDMKELLAISFDESRVILIDDIRELNQPEVLEQLMDLICADAGNGEQAETGPKEDQQMEAGSGEYSWSNWYNWYGCSATCGEDAWRKRRRYCFNMETYDYSYDDDCEGDDWETENCELAPCPATPIDESHGDIQGEFGWSQWGKWYECSGTCGAGQNKYRERMCYDRATNDFSYDCEGTDREMENCGLPPCPPTPMDESPRDIQGT